MAPSNGAREVFGATGTYCASALHAPTRNGASAFGANALTDAASTASAALGGAPGASFAATQSARPVRNELLPAVVLLVSLSSRVSTDCRNSFVTKAGCLCSAAAACSASSAKSATTPTANMVASLPFHQSGSPLNRSCPDSINRRAHAVCNELSTTVPNRSQSSSRSKPHIARTVETSSSSSATYWFESCLQDSSWSLVMHMYPNA
mmetsp:Transcript_11947/g.44455  ORF Transcript_11947/g.44455 Transcript_11947/m.44455 type:complete len:207 (+) Transcript_11947:2952-3572(+)